MSASMRGKVCLVTGASQGIGYETARGLAKLGATVVLTGRNGPRTDAAAQRIAGETGNSNVEGLTADLSVFAAVRSLAQAFLSRHDRLDVLVNNAGGMSRRRKPAEGGFEYTCKLNHLGPFLLTSDLMPLILGSAPARIVNVASGAHYRGKIDFDDLQGERRYKMWKGYQQSKLANVLFTYALARRLQGTGVTANCLHPGVVASGFVANIGPLERVLAPVIKLAMISPEEGADTPIYLASSPAVEGVSGAYFDKRRPVRSSEASYDEALQERLWILSIRQTGTRGYDGLPIA